MKRVAWLFRKLEMCVSKIGNPEYFSGVNARRLHFEISCCCMAICGMYVFVHSDVFHNSFEFLGQWGSIYLMAIHIVEILNIRCCLFQT